MGEIVDTFQGLHQVFIDDNGGDPRFHSADFVAHLVQVFPRGQAVVRGGQKRLFDVAADDAHGPERRVQGCFVELGKYWVGFLWCMRHCLASFLIQWWFQYTRIP